MRSALSRPWSRHRYVKRLAWLSAGSLYEIPPRRGRRRSGLLLDVQEVPELEHEGSPDLRCVICLRPDMRLYIPSVEERIHNTLLAQALRREQPFSQWAQWTAQPQG